MSAGPGAGRVRAMVLALCVMLPGAVRGEGTPIGTPGDSLAGAPEYFAPSGPLASLHLAPYGDLLLWAERVENRPGITTALERQRATLRAGLDWGPPGPWPFAARAGVRVSLGSDTNAQGRASFDNLAADTVETDELMARLSSPRGDRLSAGKMRSPLALTEMIWDPDLRPVGLWLAVPLGASGPVAYRLSGGAFTRSRFSTDDARVAAVQAGARWESDLDHGADLEVSYLDFSHLDDLPEQGFARQNATVVGPGGRSYASEFRVLDLQWGGRLRWGAWPVSIRLDAARNLAVDRERDAARLRLALGGPTAPHGLEAGWVLQRIEREAVCGAFNSDEWWFHSRSRGNLFWGAGGVGGPLMLRASAFLERRDDLTDRTQRYRLELVARLPAP